MSASPKKPRVSREWGDFQTPVSLATKVCRYLSESGVEPKTLVEPTCGAGNFVFSALDTFPRLERVYGVELQPSYVQEALRLMAERNGALPSVEFHTANIFTHSFPESVLMSGNILVLGNPPWVTNAELGALDSHNVPTKRNLKALNGMDAITGKSNFDLAEFVIWRMLELFSSRHGTLAMLCKNSVAKNILEMLPKRRFPISNLRILEIDALREFGAAVDACLFVADFGTSNSNWTCQVASLDAPHCLKRTFGWTRNRFVADVESYEMAALIEGVFPFVWRQGIKHDCTTIMELSPGGGEWANSIGEMVDVEREWVYPLVKSSDVKSFEISSTRKAVIVPQRSLGEDTSGLERTAPKLWAYLVRHRAMFDRRKSSVYRGKSPFTIFGIGEYSFAPYKVVISGFYKKPFFALLTPIGGRPVMTDDTCYFVGFDEYRDAVLTAAVLNSLPVLDFLKSVAFTDAKRPYTKECLSRVDLVKAAALLSFDEIQGIWRRNGFEPERSISESDFASYQHGLMSKGTKEQNWRLPLEW